MRIFADNLIGLTDGEGENYVFNNQSNGAVCAQAVWRRSESSLLIPTDLKETLDVPASDRHHTVGGRAAVWRADVPGDRFSRFS